MRYDDPEAATQWACARKKAYPTEKLAEAVARKIRRTRGADVVSYACGRCGRFHIGRRPGGG